MKEYGEDVDRMCKELEAVGQKNPALQNEKPELDNKKLEIAKLKASIAKQACDMHGDYYEKTYTLVWAF